MKFTIQQEQLLKSLSLVSGVVERRHTKPVLANILFRVEGNNLTLTATDSEIEISARLNLVENASANGSITVPAKKLVDICRALSEGSDIHFSFADGKVDIVSGRNRYALSTLPADDFPNVVESNVIFSTTILQKQLKKLIESTAFAMANEDVRNFLKGMLLEASEGQLRAVATDGHRLALCTQSCEDIHLAEAVQVIVPRKGVHELSRAAVNDDETIEMSFSQNHLTAKTERYTFITKLIDGKYPDYRRVIPSAGQNVVFGSRQALKEAFVRSSILLDERFRGTRLTITQNQLELKSNNPDQELTEISVDIDYNAEPIEIGFNVTYLIDVANALSGDNIKISLSDSNSSALIEDAEDKSALYVVMPMRL